MENFVKNSRNIGKIKPFSSVVFSQFVHNRGFCSVCENHRLHRFEAEFFDSVRQKKRPLVFPIFFHNLPFSTGEFLHSFHSSECPKNSPQFRQFSPKASPLLFHIGAPMKNPCRSLFFRTFPPFRQALLRLLLPYSLLCYFFAKKRRAAKGPLVEKHFRQV